MQTIEHVNQKSWRVRYRVFKYEQRELHEIDETTEPTEVVDEVDNILLNAGINFLLNILAGGAAGTFPPYNNANSRIVVGDSATAAVATQTDVQAATNIAEAAMDATYPLVVNQTITFKASFGSGAANFVWNEVVITNGARPISATVKALNRKVQAFGTKAAGSTWIMQIDVTIS